MRPIVLFILVFLCYPANAQHGLRTVNAGQAKLQADSIRASVEAVLADGLNLSLWASEDLIADPIALYIDDRGRAFYTRTNRQANSEFDIRGHRDWMIRSISFKTVEDRRAFLHEELAPENSRRNTWLEDLNGDGSHDWKDLLVEKEEVYRVDDTSGDGLADRAQMIVEDFHQEHTDVAGAVLYHEGDLFVGVGPDLWRMQDTDGDGVMDEKTSISHGYAIHIGFGAHGMSGLTVGPDGRIYWGIGDIGFYGTDQDGNLWDYSNQGVIVRANPDGSDFEVYAAGLRNTHEFVFDEYGNIVSEDNDGDHPGEKERLVYIVNGSDSGWRTNWQFGKYTDPDNNTYKVWMDEEYFKPRFEGQAAHITPPISLYHSGPAGMKYNPGTALGDEWKNHFFVAEFVGTPARSKVHAFRLKPKGATFELADERVAVSGVLTSGMAFGPDGALYLADWIDGWGTKDEGRIWKLDVAGEAKNEERAEVQELLAASFEETSNKTLRTFLEHSDMRVRQKAQFELAGRGRKGAKTLRAAVKQNDHQLARIHGLWGLAQMARQKTRYAKDLTRYLDDNDPEIRAQAAKMIGDLRFEPAAKGVIPLLKNSNARPRFFAAEALGRIGYKPAVEPILEMLEANNDEDAYLRHAGALALARIGDVDALMALENHTSKALRIAAVVALRRLQHPGVAAFLDDEDEHIATDAARAINDDASIEDALPTLAEILETMPFTNEALLRRAINANSRLGGSEEARRLTDLALREDLPEAIRAEAIDALAVWGNPSVVDRVDGTYRGPDARDAEPAFTALQGASGSLMTDEKSSVRIAIIEAIARLDIKYMASRLLSLLRNDSNADVRVAALKAIDVLADEIPAALEVALADEDPQVRMEALSIVPAQNMDEDEKVHLLAGALVDGTVEEQQLALDALGKMEAASVKEVLGTQVDSLGAGSLNPAIFLELGEAISAVGSEELQARYKMHVDSLPAYFDALEGGNPREGARIFYQNQAAQCARCHNAGRGGGDVGPGLQKIGSQLTRQELLESLVDPSVRIAPGYGEGVSSMPAMGSLLSRREIRDLVAFLDQLE